MRADNRLDQKLLVLVTLGLVAFGLVMVYSATSASAAVGNGDPMAFLERQAIYAFLGVVLMALASRFDYHRLRYVAPPLMLVALGLCAAVLVVAPEINGARRWFLLGPASFQPSELAKLALCLFAAVYLARRRPPRTLGELAKPLGLPDRALLRADPARARPRDDDHALRDDARRPPRRRGSRPPAGDRVVPRDRRRAARDLRGALPARPRLQLPRPLERRRGVGIPDRAGDDRDRLGWRDRRRASARASGRSRTSRRRTRT